MIFRVANRNLFDSLFLLFLCLPIISNIFALFAQVATKEITFSSSKIDKKAVVAEQTRILELEHKKQKEKEAILIKKRREAAKAKTQLIKAEELKTREMQAKVEAEQVAKLEVKSVVTKKVTKKVPTKKPVVKKPKIKKPSVKKTTIKKSAKK